MKREHYAHIARIAETVGLVAALFHNWARRMANQ
jgi:hypothetical protein